MWRVSTSAKPIDSFDDLVGEKFSAKMNSIWLQIKWAINESFYTSIVLAKAAT